MSIFSRRARCADASDSAAALPPLAFEITMDELRMIERVTRHARARLRELSDSSESTITKGSGSALVPVLYERAGAADALGRSGIPMLIGEIAQVEAAVLNLESYAGHETVLCDGYSLLNRLAFLKGRVRVTQEIAGVVTLPGGAADAPRTTLT